MVGTNKQAPVQWDHTHTKVGVALVRALLLEEEIDAFFTQGLADEIALVDVIVAAIQGAVDDAGMRN